MSGFNVEFYTKSNGEKPAKDFLLSLDEKMKVKAFGIVELLQEYGNQLREPYSKPLEDGIFELRISFVYRVCCHSISHCS